MCGPSGRARGDRQAARFCGYSRGDLLRLRSGQALHRVLRPPAVGGRSMKEESPARWAAGAAAPAPAVRRRENLRSASFRDYAIAGGEPVLGAVVVGVGRTCFAVGIGLGVESPLRFRLALLVLRTIPAQARKRHRFEPFLGDLQSARLADAIGAIVDTPERVVDLLELDAFAVRQNEVDLAIALFGREV